MNLKFLRYAAPICLGLTLLTVGGIPADAGESQSYTVIKAVPMEVNRNVKAPSNNMSTDISEDQALKIVQSAFPDLDWKSKPEISLEPSGPDQMCWNINLYSQNFFSRPRNFGFHARVDAVTGEILNIQNEIPETGAGQIIPREKARIIAEDFIGKMQPEKISYLELDDGPDPRMYYSPERKLDITYQFNWWRRVNGHRIADSDGIRVTVDALSGKIRLYSYNWQKDFKLPLNTKDLIPAKEICSRLIRDTGMILSYHVPYGGYSGAIPKAKLVYRLNSSYRIMDALTGEYMDHQGQPVEPAALKQFGEIPQISGDMNPPSPGTKRISPSTAQEKAERFFHALGYDGKVERSGGGSGSGPLGRQEFWSYSLKSNEFDNLRVGIEVFSGRAANFHGRDLGPDQAVISGGKILSQDEALKKAHDFIAKIEPEISRFLVADYSGPWSKEAANPAYSFHFSRVSNGIPFPQDGIHITIGQDGQIINYNCNWHRVEFPPAEARISPADAASKWLESSPFKPAYFSPRDEMGRAGETRLVYMTQYNGVESIDALTGEVITGDGRTPNSDPFFSYDFSESWASRQLQILAQNKLLPPPEKFSASSPASRRESILILLAAATPLYYNDDRRPEPFFQDIEEDDPDFKTIQTAVEIGFLEKGGSFQPGDNLTRKTLAEWLVRGLGYKEAAAIPNKIEVPFKDISTLSREEQNNIALANGLGLLSGEGDSFRPGAAVTWEELSAAVMKAAPGLRNRLGIR